MTAPLREPTYFVLASLLEGPLHGYAILARAAELSEGRVRLSTGTLYGALDRLSAAALVTAGEEQVVEGRVRRAYSLTEQGEQLLREEAERLTAAARVVTAHRRRPGLGTA